jgi:Ca2+-binding RTX toxin-like protein
MSLTSVLAAIHFDTSIDDTKTPGLESKIRLWITILYNSETGAALLESAASRGILNFSGISGAGTTGGNPINIDENQIENLVSFNQLGTLVKVNPVMVLAHELRHAVDGPEANDPNDGRTPTDDLLNSADWITDGPAVQTQNAVARELVPDFPENGYGNQIRVSYFASGSQYQLPYRDLIQNYSYTNGGTIDLVRLGLEPSVGGIGSTFIDHSLRTTKLRDLLFGTTGNDRIYAGAGRDYLYGGLGDDLIHGGYNSAVGAGSIVSDGADTAGYTDLSGITPIQIRIGGTPLSNLYQAEADFNRAIFVSGFQEGTGVGIDTLISIEKIIGTENNDILTIDSLSAIYLADPTTRQGGLVSVDMRGQLASANNPGDLVDLIGCDEAARIIISDQNMVISAVADATRRLTVIGAESIIATGFNDIITANTGRAMTISGGDGDDRINGGTGGDTLSGDSNNDIINGRDGFDTIDGGDGMDIISGGLGIDTIFGGENNDRLSGNEDGDFIFGGFGDDTLYSGSGFGNMLYGDGDIDTIIFDNGGSGTAEGGQGDDIIDARRGQSVGVNYRIGDGFDTIRASYSFQLSTLTVANYEQVLQSANDPRNVGAINFEGLSIDDYRLVWSPRLLSSEADEFGTMHYLYSGNLSIVDKATGTTGISLGVVIGESISLRVTINTTYLHFEDLPQLTFSDGQFDNGSEGQNMDIEIASGTALRILPSPSDVLSPFKDGGIVILQLDGLSGNGYSDMAANNGYGTPDELASNDNWLTSSVYNIPKMADFYI